MELAPPEGNGDVEERLVLFAGPRLQDGKRHIGGIATRYLATAPFERTAKTTREGVPRSVL